MESGAELRVGPGSWFILHFTSSTSNVKAISHLIQEAGASASVPVSGGGSRMQGFRPRPAKCTLCLTHHGTCLVTTLRGPWPGMTTLCTLITAV